MSGASELPCSAHRKAVSLLKTTHRLSYCPAYPSFGQEIIGDNLAAWVTYLLKMSEISAWTFGLRRQSSESSPVTKKFSKPMDLTTGDSMGQAAR